MRVFFDILITMSYNLYISIENIIKDPNKGFIASLTGTGTFTIPSYIYNVVGLQTPDAIMTLQTIGLIITILLGFVSLIKNLWDLFDKVMRKLKKNNIIDDEKDKPTTNIR